MNGRDPSALVLGEIHTQLLPTATPIDPRSARRLVESLVAFQAVTESTRPIHRVSSPTQLVGVDCLAPTARDLRCRVVGTVCRRSTLIGGWVLQLMSWATIVASAAGRGVREDWSQYLARPGTLEAMSRLDTTDAVAGFTTFAASDGAVEWTDIARRNWVQMRRVVTELAGYSEQALRPPITEFRFTITRDADENMTLRLLSEGESSSGRRAFALQVAEPEAAEHLAFVEQVAANDWLLTAATAQSQIAGRASQTALVVEALHRPVVHLIPMWRPTAALNKAARIRWAALDDIACMTQQWEATAGSMRDELLVALAGTLHDQRGER